jgi:hypothetical protein
MSSSCNCAAVLAILAGVAMSLLAHPAMAQDAAPAASDAAVRARALFDEGLAATKAERWGDARHAFAAALELKRAPILLYSLAVAERNSGELVAALQHFDEFLSQPVEPATKPFQEPARTALTALNEQVPHVIIVVQPEGTADVSLRIDGAAAPPLASDKSLLLDPGNHVISAVAPGYIEAREELALNPGDEITVSLTLQRSPTAAQPAQPSAREPAVDEGSGVLLPIGLVTAGFGVAALGAALGFKLASAGAEQDVKDADGQIEAAEHFDTAESLQLGAQVMAGIGGVLTAAGLIMLFVDLSSGDELQPSAALRTGCTGAGCQFQIVGTF